MTIVWFILVGIVGTASLAALSFSRWRWWWRVALALLITVVVAGGLIFTGPSYLGKEQWFDKSPFREFFLFAMMVLGMAARVLSLAIEEYKTKKDPAKGLEMSRWDFVYPLLFAVPTFGALLSQIGSETITFANVVLSFQNGFFWQTILKRTDAKLAA
jgi:hypothetical protein